ncbi:hypothetical protein [Persicitalea jodogahamensis]|uniref:Uncharacterized protein n=1 Tax=Persicitalea jodogahamensis TaxID=402147 RepID=A0A8J3D099_9BACT|nr:hypothetical protein [Persicitalea jodogahamensis]GHB51711.1 hypothetical protein GCM10007390_00330 [Persicitalea jodogahamensis]
MIKEKIKFIDYWAKQLVLQEQIEEIKSSTFTKIIFSIDGLLFILHILIITPLLSDPIYDVRSENGYPEMYQYFKEFIIVVLLLRIVLKTKIITFLIWVFLFAYLLFDDSFQIHENVGYYLANTLSLPPLLGLRIQDFGELLVSFTVFSVLCLFLLLFYRTAPVLFQRATIVFFILLCMLAFFGIVVDMLHVVVASKRITNYVLGSIEDGGEMLVVSLMTVYAYYLNFCYSSQLLRS